ncbi:hypothetical protein Trydic_g20008 [Trypoxylus dichotomus]
MEQRYWACCMDQNTNTEPKAAGRQKALSRELLFHAVSDRTWFLPGVPSHAPERQQAEMIIGHVTPTVIVARMLQNEGKAVDTMVRKIMGQKGSHERSGHRPNMQSELRME